MMESQEEIRALWHDITKYMNSMEALVSNDKLDEANSILNDLRSTVASIHLVVDTGNEIIDSILSYEMKSAKKNNVVLKPTVWVSNNLDIPASDLFIILGNTLDNAIEASRNLSNKKDRYIEVDLYQKNHLLSYVVKNKYSSVVAKKPGNIHGYGLKNVKSCVEKNHGSMTVSNFNNTFEVRIVLNV